MRWDDLWLLRLIDEHEEDGLTSYLSNGHELLRRAAELLNYQVNWDRDLWPFARELILAADAGFVEWRDMSGNYLGDRDPQSNPNNWLQQVHNLRLTIAGRDRARGGSSSCRPPTPTRTTVVRSPVPRWRR